MIFFSFFEIRKVYKKRYNIFICEAILKLNPILEFSWNSLSVLVLIDIQSTFINTKRDYLCSYMCLYYQYIDIICITTYVNNVDLSQSNIPQNIQIAHQKSAKLCLKIRKHITPLHCVFQLLSTMWSLLLMVLALTGISTSSVSSYHEDNRKKVCLICGRKCSYVLQNRHFKDLKEIMPDFSRSDFRYPLVYVQGNFLNYLLTNCSIIYFGPPSVTIFPLEDNQNLYNKLTK